MAPPEWGEGGRDIWRDAVSVTQWEPRGETMFDLLGSFLHNVVKS